MKHLSKFFTLLTFFALSTTFVACSSDDDDDSGGTAKASVFQLTTVNGDRVYLKSCSCSGNYYYYNSDGLLAGWDDGYDNYTVSYNPMRITYDGYDDDGLGSVNVSLNSSGYISNMSGSYKNDVYSVSINLNLDFSYNSNGQLQSISCTANGTMSGYTYTLSASSSYKYSNGVLKTVTIKSIEKLNGSTASYTDKCEYTYEYGYTYENTNTTRQYTSSLVDCMPLEIDLLFDLPFVGLFGKASYELPTTVTCSENEDGDTSVDYDIYTYTFNDDGTVASENGWKYTYYDVDDIISTRAGIVDTETTEAIPSDNIKKPRSLFKSFREKMKAIQAQEQQ